MVQVPVNQQLRLVHIHPLQLLGEDLALGVHEYGVQLLFKAFEVLLRPTTGAQLRDCLVQSFDRRILRCGIVSGRVKYLHRGSLRISLN